jgi:hypothetical protein
MPLESGISLFLFSKRAFSQKGFDLVGARIQAAQKL